MSKTYRRKSGNIIWYLNFLLEKNSFYEIKPYLYQQDSHIYSETSINKPTKYDTRRRRRSNWKKQKKKIFEAYDYEDVDIIDYEKAYPNIRWKYD